ncbi:MAG: efflux RND transporter permease subunit [Candidatus Omnitrophica bacterium]|nr:efflux RND transporter permease subunit [Candidatus Omnitrophota bacterium]
MSIVEFSVKRSLLVNLISVFILVAGFLSVFVFKIRREAFPEVSYDIVIVSTVYPGAAPEEVEKLVTIPIEKELKGVDGIEKMKSTSLENSSNISIEISQDVKNKRKVITDIQKAVDRVRDLPAGVEDDPVVSEVTSGEFPVVQVALSGDMPEKELQEYAENLEDILEDIPGVSKISRIGYRDREVWVEVDPQKLSSFHLSLEEVMEALARKNRSIPGGKIRGVQEFSIRTTGEFYTKEEIEDVVIRANETGNWLRVKDVAEVKFSFEDENTINKSFGTRSIDLTVIKRASGDAIEIVEKVKLKTEKFLTQTNDSRLETSYINDISFYIKRRLGTLKNNGIVGIVLVCFVLMIFLQFRIALITAIGLPIAFCATLAVMSFVGLSINLVTMFGLIVVLGMLVDDGIIVSENCSRYLEEGHSPYQAAILGTQEVIKPVTTTIITTIAAFSPLLFMGGMMGKFIWGIPLVVIIALCASLFEALVILPSHFADFIRRDKNFKSRKELPWFKKLVVVYTRLVTKALNRRWWVLGGLFLVLILTVGLVMHMPKILFASEEGIEEFTVRAEAPVGTNLYSTDKLIKPIEEEVAKMPKNQVEAYTTQVGSIGDSWHFDPYGKSGSHVVQVTVHLTPYKQRKRKVSQIIEDLRTKIGDVEGFDRVYFEKPQAGPPVGAPVAVEIRGESFEVLNKIANQINEFLKTIPGISDIVSDYEVGRGEIRVIVDEEKAARTYLSVGEVASSIRNAFRGGVATSIKPVKAEEEIDVLVRFPDDYRTKRESFEKILVPNKFGNLIPLAKIARFEDGVSVARVQHLDGKRVISVKANVDNQNITSNEANKLIKDKFKDVSINFPGYSIQFGGEQRENVRSMKDFANAFILALFLIFLILAANFNSLVQPLIVMMAIPFGFIGVIWAFFFHGLPIGFFMFMGAVGLTGIVVNDSIVLVEFVNNLRRKGVDRRHSLIQAGQLRLRPVLLTTITTALGLTPTAYGIWGGDPFLKPMALTIVWGIVCATVLTLVVLPCIYAIIDDITLKLAGHTTVKKSNITI